MNGAPAPIVVTALFGSEDAAWFERQRRAHFPVAHNQVSAHLTLFHHLPPSIAPELKHRLQAETRGQQAPEAQLGVPYSLGGGVAYGIESPGLATIRTGLADAFAGLLTPQDSTGWRPHVTVQNKVQTAEARRLLAQLTIDFRPRRITIAGFAAWWYHGGPWEMLSRHMFA
ncbi:2'-5' RNA ligase family protein [Hephaestia sp. GCM10023244]|uniref:2'-5' RNA ligase family protein n=1 Tax=unclassified Hephaestia TaxID=2631281 RepID=UPI0020772A44|nr:2'-5' RNA ligase family protein [Hephaestia sp. MAHUQ-44]MCM8732176.1 2'-5' RNA ligase family protein [Hephaestia sp. MAHUQ-44]